MYSLQTNIFRKLLAELIATFAMILFGTGAIVVNDITNGRIGQFGIAITFGIVIGIMIYAAGPISGAHMNPAVTFALAASKKFPAILILPYICAQCSGAILASYVLFLVFPGHSTLGATLPHGSIVQAFAAELLLTFVLAFTILMIAKRSSAKWFNTGVIVGLIVALASFYAGPISGASINPARSLGPAVISAQYFGLWIYLVAPMVGAMLAVLIFSIALREIHHSDHPGVASQDAGKNS